MWRSIHVVALGLPRDADRATKDAYVAFYESLKTVLPCIQCSQGYTKIVATTKPTIAEAVEAGPDALFSWTVDVHNKVAQKLGQEPMNEDYIRDHYMFGEGRCDGKNDGKGGRKGDGNGGSTGPAESTEAVGAGKGESARAGPGGKSAEGAPWSQEVFRRHSGNPVIVYLAALFALGLVFLVLWYSARVSGRR